MISIIYDYQIFSWQRYGGISRYFYELASHLSTNKNLDVKILAGTYVNQYIKQLKPGLVVGTPVPKIAKTGIIRDFLNKNFSTVWLKANPPQVVHETFHSTDGVAPSKTPTVLTVHDFIHEKFYPDSDIVAIKAASIRRADHLICISENTRKELLDLFNISPSKISVIYHASSLADFTSESKQAKINLQFPYILYVGDRYGYKNFSGLLQAYASSDQLKKNFKLVCFGGLPLTSGELNRASQLGITENNLLHFTGSDSLLKQLYQGASAFVYPSLQEGFGIPPLEAMSLSCPVVCSNTSSIPEVVGNAGELFDPYDLDSIAGAMERVLSSGEYASNLVQRGLKRAKDFSWKTCAEQTSLVYSSLVGSGKLEATSLSP